MACKSSFLSDVLGSCEETLQDSCCSVDRDSHEMLWSGRELSSSFLTMYHTPKGYGIKIPTAGDYTQLSVMLDLGAE